MIDIRQNDQQALNLEYTYGKKKSIWHSISQSISTIIRLI